MGGKNPATTSVEDLRAAASSHGGAKLPKTDHDLGSSLGLFSCFDWETDFMMTGLMRYLYPELELQRPPPPASNEEHLVSLFKHAINMRRSIVEGGEIVDLKGNKLETLSVFDEQFSQLFSKLKGNSMVMKAAKEVSVETGIKVPFFEELLLGDGDDKSAEEKSADEPKSAEDKSTDGTKIC